MSEEALEWKLGTPPSEPLVMVAVLRLYAEFLTDALQQLEGKTGCEQQLSNLQEHLSGALHWLIENGHLEPRTIEQASSAVN
jgi:hypothetical protein